MDIVDINRSGKVDFTGKWSFIILEFIIAAMNKEKLLSMEKMNQAFTIIDLVIWKFISKDGDNFISKKELEYVMGDIDDDVYIFLWLKIWKQILLECDGDGDG